MGLRIVMATWGSFGDLHPYLAVAIGLRQRGHDVTIATSEVYRNKIEGECIGFWPVRPDVANFIHDQKAIQQANDLKHGTEFVVRSMVLPYLEQSYEDVLAISWGADLLVGHPLTYALPLIGEKFGRPWISVALQPLSLFSTHDPSIFAAAPNLHRLRRIGRWPYMLPYNFLKAFTRSWAKPVDELRRKIGLPPARKHPLIEGAFSPYGTLGWFSPLLASPQPDWPPRTDITGFPFYDRWEHGKSLDSRLADFLTAGEPPIVFTLGSSAVFEAGDFYQQSLKAVMQLGRRAVLLIGIDERNRLSGRLPETVFVTEYAPYSELLQHAAATVHHGGIGTTAQALRAGRPMLVVPYSHDQPDNAARASRLGLARVLYRHRYDSVRAAGELKCLLSDGSYAAKAAEIGDKIRSERGVLQACDAIERFARPVIGQRTAPNSTI